MANKTSDFSASVAHFKAIADEKLAKLRESAQFKGFVSEEAVDAFARIDSSAFAGRCSKHSKAS